MRKWNLALAASLGATGCFATTHVSSFGPLVRDVEVRRTAQGGAVVVETCELKYTEVNTYDFWPDWGSGSSRSTKETYTSMSVENCTAPRPVEVRR